MICDLLGLDSSSDPNGDAEKILNFLLEPTDQGKPIITKKAEHVEDDDDEDEKVEVKRNGMTMFRRTNLC